MTYRLVSAIYADYHPFNQLKGVARTACYGKHDEEVFQQNDILVVHGGADISPSLYNKGRSYYSGAHSTPSRRDAIEWKLMQQAKAQGVPIIGICRGAQMLCALAGGTLYQDVDNHFGEHLVETNEEEIITVNSIHHQMMCLEGTKHELLAWAYPSRSTVYWDVDGEGFDVCVNANIEPEFVYFPDVKGFAIQWHPEMMDVNEECNRYVLRVIEDKLNLFTHEDANAQL
jgi:putative glutamine amidotransferase